MSQDTNLDDWKCSRCEANAITQVSWIICAGLQFFYFLLFPKPLLCIFLAAWGHYYVWPGKVFFQLHLHSLICLLFPVVWLSVCVFTSGLLFMLSKRRSSAEGQQWQVGSQEPLQWTPEMFNYTHSSQLNDSFVSCLSLLLTAFHFECFLPRVLMKPD